MNLETSIKSTVLDALIDKVTSCQTEEMNFNRPAINAFIKIVINELELVPLALRLLTCKMQSPYEWEALQALRLLAACTECEAKDAFLAEISKFRFLNEVIKLVSPKYLGNLTPAAVKHEIINLLDKWVVNYPRETKIKEAYEMLLKQGVIVKVNFRERNEACSSSCTGDEKLSVYEDDNDTRIKMLKKLIASSKPWDVRAANLLIQTIVKENKEKEDLSVISNSVNLLSEMLSGISSESSVEDNEIINELKETCINKKPLLASMISTSFQTRKESGELLKLNDLINDTLLRYHNTMPQIMEGETEKTEVVFQKGSHDDFKPSSYPLLDLNFIDSAVSVPNSDPMEIKNIKERHSNLEDKTESEVEMLRDIFTAACLIPKEDKNENSSGDYSIDDSYIVFYK